MNILSEDLFETSSTLNEIHAKLAHLFTVHHPIKLQKPKLHSFSVTNPKYLIFTYVDGFQ